MLPKGIQSNYLLSEIPEPWTIMGRELLPFSIGHWVALQRWECWPPKEEEDFVLAIILCSKTWEQGLKWVTSRFQSRVDLLGMRFRVKRLGFMKRIKVWKTFNLYLEEHFFEPGFISSGETGGAGLPSCLHLKTRLMRDFGMSEAQVMDYPLRKAMFLIRADQESRGQITIFDKAEAKEAANAYRQSVLGKEAQN